MKKIRFSVFVALAGLFALASCQKEAETLEISAAQVSFSAFGGEEVISFTSNSAWTMSSDAAWVTVTPSEGIAGPATVKLTADANDSFDVRNATVTLKAGSKTVTWKVSQDFAQVFGAGTPVSVSAAAQDIAVEVTTNEAFTAESKVDWISVVATKSAPVAKAVTVSVKANASITPREGQVAITSASGSVYSITIRQAASENAMSLASVVYLGSSQCPRDFEASAPKILHEYALTFSTAKGNVVICVNAKDNVLAGSYSVDAAGNHADETFSIKPAEGYVKYYTTITEGVEEIVVADGAVEISTEGNQISISADLVDSHEITRSYTFSGTLPEVTESAVGAASYVSYSGDWATHFGNGQKEYGVTLYPSSAVKDGGTFYHAIGFTLEADKSYDGKTFPTGKYEFQEAGNAASGYANGNTLYVGNALEAGYSYWDYAGKDEYGNEISKYAKTTAGYVNVTEGMEGTYNFELNLTLQRWHYDDDWNEVLDGDPEQYVYTFENVAVTINDSHQDPIEDVDQVFTSAFPMADYSGMWFGDAYANGGNVFVAGWASGVNNTFSCQMTIQIAAPWTWEANFNGKYCKTPIPAGEYPFIGTAVSEEGEGGVKTPVNGIVKTTFMGSYGCVKNSYTGTAAEITGGSFTVGDGIVKFNLVCTTASGKELHYTGEFASTAYYFRDYTASKYAKYVALP